MKIFFGIVIGLVWGAAVSYLYGTVVKKAVAEGKNSKIVALNSIQIIVDILALGILFFVKDILKVNFIALIFSAVVALSITRIVMSYYAVYQKNDKDDKLEK